MIRSEFVLRDQTYQSFSVTGHSGLAPAPHDILCASVSAMTMLTLNTATEVFGADLSITVEEETPRIAAELRSVPEEGKAAVQGLIHGLFLQLEDLGKQYPDHVSVRTKK